MTLIVIGFSARAQTLPGSGNALTFNGVNSYINCGPGNRGITQQVTVEAWIKTSSNAYQWILGKYFNSVFEEKGYHLVVSGGNAYFNGRIGIGVYMSSGPSAARIDDGKWHHLAGVCNFSTWQIYVDGILENTGVYPASQSDLTTTTPMVIGCYDVQSGQFFNGDIDEVRVWRTARTQAEIRDNMCRKFAAAPTSLAAYYRLDQASGSTALDNGSVPTTGNLVNIAATNWHLSGAPLGDASSNLYASAWPAGSRVALGTASGDSAIVSGVSAQSRGVQVYAVNSAPSIAPPGVATPSYVGVFAVGAPATATTYALRIRPQLGPNCRNAYSRSSNDLGWNAVAQPPTSSTSLLFPNAVYRNEYILSPGVITSADITGDSTICASARTQLTLTSPATFTVLWNTGATTPTLSNVAPGVYTATVSFATGCSRVLRRTVRAFQVPSLAISGDSAVCPGTGTSLTAAASGATAYLWSTGATTATASITQPGIYTVTATYGSGCTVVARRTVRLNSAGVPAAFTLGADTTLCEGDQVLLQGPVGASYRYQWSDGSANRQLLVQTSGRYTLRVITACGEQSASRTVAVNNCLKVPNVVTADADKKNDFFAIKGLKGDGWALDVYNRWGRAVFQTANYRNDWGAEAAPGLYFVLLRRPATGYVYKGWVEVLR
ncbi:LamG-like jellyroll fold domain-containing protein [Hymenobacter armeniacus]|uniref:Gliding motility-associated C-terminal domain-containing protein n=1 Tax=Hymenobacter armeniacus TaxID=2771358 RepID=A0ABR8JLA3_9BACT|nr:LamG-like jellyroll fold domain-containing protein [Hymenobacter armeniacus]MBD2720780.1 gliding motility-associated C-terminal domain-containing protein [Hymenobacter armeniacus]